MGTKTNLTDLWRDRGKGYRDEFQNHSWLVNRRFRQQEKQILKTLKKLEFSSVLEIGCGFGRISRLILEDFNVKYQYDAFDVSSEQIHNASEYLRDLGYSSLCISTIADYPSHFKHRDLVCAFEVFMHLPPEEIEDAIRKAAGLANRYVVNVDWCCEGEAKQAGGYCWQHDYPELYREAGVNFVETVELNDHWLAKLFPDLRLRQKLFIAEKKERI